MEYNFDQIRVLIVDDEELIREILVDAFTQKGAKVDMAESGNEALTKVHNNKYDMVITDINMPNGDGISFLENIKKMPQPTPKLFVCSAYNDFTPARIKELGISKIFTKPIDLSQLIATMSDFFA